MDSHTEKLALPKGYAMNIQFSTQELTLLLISFAVILLLAWVSTLYFLKRESA